MDGLLPGCMVTSSLANYLWAIFKQVLLSSTKCEATVKLAAKLTDCVTFEHF